MCDSGLGPKGHGTDRKADETQHCLMPPTVGGDIIKRRIVHVTF